MEIQLVLAIPVNRLSGTTIEAVMDEVWSQLNGIGVFPAPEDSHGDEMSLVNGNGYEPTCIYRPEECDGPHELVSVHGVGVPSTIRGGTV